ncbi:hypothetical protein YB2330_001542 [Saitoella coloradoensis]
MAAHYSAPVAQDISTLDVVGDDTLVAQLRQRCSVNKFVATIGTSTLLSVNPWKDVGIVEPEQGKQTPDTETEVTVKKWAEKVWTYMKITSTPQSILLLGETNSGKSHNRRTVVSSLLSKTCPSQSLTTRIDAAQFILESFGHAKTVNSMNASRYGLYLEMQYNAKAECTGAKFLDYKLEKSRVPKAPTAERNFHAFYYLLSGLTPEDLSHLELDPNARYRYLGHPNQRHQGLINDEEGFSHLRTAMRRVGISKDDIAQCIQLMAAILHLGQLEFVEPSSDQEYARVRNTDVLAAASAFLGVVPETLEMTLAFKTTMVKRERVTLMLDARAAQAHTDDLARTLYSLLWSWIVEKLNSRLCVDEGKIQNTISVLDFPGMQNDPETVMDGLFVNMANETFQRLMFSHCYERDTELYKAEGLEAPTAAYLDNTTLLDTFLRPSDGVFAMLDEHTGKHSKGKTNSQFMLAMEKRFASSDDIKISSQAGYDSSLAFMVKHYWDEVTYDCSNLLEANTDVISGDLMTIFRGEVMAEGGSQLAPTSNDFVARLFKSEAVKMEVHPRSKTTITQAQLPSKPMRQPSMVRRTATAAALAEKKKDKVSGVAGQFASALRSLKESIDGSQSWFLICLKPNDRRLANQFDSGCMLLQAQAFGLSDLAQRVKENDYTIHFSHKVFLDNYVDMAAMGMENPGYISNERDACLAAARQIDWPEKDIFVGQSEVFLSDAALAYFLEANKVNEALEAQFSEDDRQDIRREEIPVSTPDSGEASWASSYVRARAQVAEGVQGLQENARRIGASLVPVLNDQNSLPGTPLSVPSRRGSNDMELRPMSYLTTSDFNGSTGNLFQHLETRSMLEKDAAVRAVEEERITETHEVTGARKRWVFIVYFLTWWIPDFLIRHVGRMKRKDVRMAWREKLAINMLIWLLLAFSVFFIVGLSELICPKEYVFSPQELIGHSSNNNPDAAYAAIRGEVFDLTQFAPVHPPSGIVPSSAVLKYAGLDATKLFPVQVSALCQGTTGSVDPSVTLDFVGVNSTDNNAHYHDFRSFTNDSRPDWYWNSMTLLRQQFRTGYMGYTRQYIQKQAQNQQAWGIIDGNVYDLSSYIQGGRHILVAGEEAIPEGVDTNFMDQDVVNLFQQRAGADLTKAFAELNLDTDLQLRMRVCLRNLFFIGKVDNRNSARCIFANYLVLIISIALMSIIAFKFFAALQFGKTREPEKLDKFVIMMMPAYTEGEESLRKSINSLAKMRYEDKRKLMFIVCDGNVVGAGNTKPTPRIILDILGHDPSFDPEPLSFDSLGEGQKQHNMGKVYAGLYEVAGHIVPYLVIVKAGKPSEVIRAGNRGKRDSQMVLMRFLNRVNQKDLLTPLELAMYHQIHDVIGVHPSLYEYCLMIDADTIVAPDACTRLVSAFIHDTRLIGACGETSLQNPKESFTTMIQPYEYFLSHNLAKNFESLFGSVTCLPGCFSMYRIRNEDNDPLFVSNDIIDAYSNNRVDTLHLKNLLHLGEDRYLTTLLMKHHPSFKTKFIRDAYAKTVAPSEWSVLISQRRRWINSTVHNLLELTGLKQLCGFCCFSMRFIVFMDLAATLIQPVTVGYLAYLIYRIIQNTSSVPVLSLVLLGLVYGLQALVFIFRRKWEMTGFMILFILAIPIYSVLLPLYSFWHMDDFSWGSTRVVMGEKGRKIVISDEGTFDPNDIPRRTWEEYVEILMHSKAAKEAKEAEAMMEKGSIVQVNVTAVPGRNSDKSGFSSISERTHTIAPTMSSSSGPEDSSLPFMWNMNNLPRNSISLPRESAHPPVVSNATSSFGSSFQPIRYDIRHQQSTSLSDHGLDSAQREALQELERTARMATLVEGSDRYTPSQAGSTFSGSQHLSHLRSIQSDRSSEPILAALPAPVARAPGITFQQMPSDDVIINEIGEILRVAEAQGDESYSSLTTKTVRRELEAKFGMSLKNKRYLIQEALEAYLSGDL